MDRRARGVTHGIEHPVVAAATAEVAGKGLAHLGLGGVGVVPVHGLGGHDHAGDAETALDPATFQEAVLNGAELTAGGEPLHGLDVRAPRLGREVEAGVYRVSIDDDSTGAAFADAAAELRALELEVVAQEIEQRDMGQDLPGNGLAVHGEVKSHRLSHSWPPEGGFLRARATARPSRRASPSGSGHWRGRRLWGWRRRSDRR